MDSLPSPGSAPTSTPPPHFDVIIVGAGASGLSCARRLFASHPSLSILLLESRPRPGGRCYTDASFGDVGGAWLHGVDGSDPRSINCLFDEAGGLAASSRMDWDDGVVYDGETGERLPDALLAKAEKEWSLVERRVEKLQDKGDVDSSLEAGVERAVAELTKAGKLPALRDDPRLLHLFKSESYDLDYGSFLSDTSLWYFDNDRITEGDAVPKNGYGNLLQTLVGFAPPEESPSSELRLNHVVSSIAYETGGGEGNPLVAIGTVAHGSFSCRHCVVTVPLGVLQASRIAFSPSLPSSFTASLQQNAMGLLNKSILLFDEVFWDDASVLYCLASPPRRPYVGWFFNDHKYSGGCRKALVFLTGSDDARDAETKTDDERTAELVDILRCMYGERCRPPVKSLHTRWLSDEFARGSYSYRRVGFDPNVGFKGFQMPYWDERLFFAGEHTNREYSSTVHGAVVSGRRAADQVSKSVTAERDK